MAHTIEPVADTAQIRTVCGIARAIWFEHYPGIISWAQVHYMLERAYRPDVVASEIAAGVRWDLVQDSGAPVGFCAYRASDAGVSLDKIYLDSAVRRRGLSRLCLERIVDFARAAERSAIVLTVNKRNLGSIAAYLRLGFSFTGSVVKPIGHGFVMDDYVMRRLVQQSLTRGSRDAPAPS
jgi:diamine N-acetyltransferase